MDSKGTGFEFELKTKVKFGSNEALTLGNYLREEGFKKVLLIIDSDVRKTPYAKEVEANLNPLEVIDYNFGEPTYELLEEYRIKLLATLHHPRYPLTLPVSKFDGIVAVGGGSVIDFAKGLSFLTANLGPALDYRGFPTNIQKPFPPVIAVPTTAGTGSEVTFNAVFIDRLSHRKLGINTKLNFPVLALLDPVLTLSCPDSIIASCGMDALTHAIESYGATKSNKLTKSFSKEAIYLLANNLEHVLSSPKDLEIRSNLMLGSYLAGIALMNSGSGPAGALSYILGPNFNVPHGLAGAVFLPHIVEHNEEHGFQYEELDLLCDLSWLVFELCKTLKIECNSLNQFGVTEFNVDVLLKGIETLQPAFNQNPVPFTVEDAKNIVRFMI
jgi:alcohol dehydrogenase